MACQLAEHPLLATCENQGQRGLSTEYRNRIVATVALVVPTMAAGGIFQPCCGVSRASTPQAFGQALPPGSTISASPFTLSPWRTGQEMLRSKVMLRL